MLATCRRRSLDVTPTQPGLTLEGINEVRRLLDVGSGSDPTGLQIPRPQHPPLRILRRVDKGAVQPAIPRRWTSPARRPVCAS